MSPQGGPAYKKDLQEKNSRCVSDKLFHKIHFKNK